MPRGSPSRNGADARSRPAPSSAVSIAPGHARLGRSTKEPAVKILAPEHQRTTAPAGDRQLTASHRAVQRPPRPGHVRARGRDRLQRGPPVGGKVGALRVAHTNPLPHKHDKPDFRPDAPVFGPATPATNRPEKGYEPAPRWLTALWSPSHPNEYPDGHGGIYLGDRVAHKLDAISASRSTPAITRPTAPQPRARRDAPPADRAERHELDARRTRGDFDHPRSSTSGFVRARAPIARNMATLRRGTRLSARRRDHRARGPRALNSSGCPRIPY